MSQVSYQPGDRWWAFQSVEATIFVCLAAPLVGLTVSWVSRRLAWSAPVRLRRLDRRAEAAVSRLASSS